MYLATILNSMLDWLCVGNRWIIRSRTKTTGWWRISSRTAKTGQDVCTISFKSIITGHVRRLLGEAMCAAPPFLCTGTMLIYPVLLNTVFEFGLPVKCLKFVMWPILICCLVLYYFFTLSQRYVSNLMYEIWIPFRVFRLFLHLCNSVLM